MLIQKLKVFSLFISLQTIDEIYAVLNGSTVYSLLDCILGYHHIAISSEVKMKFTFGAPFGKFEFKKYLLV